MTTYDVALNETNISHPVNIKDNAHDYRIIEKKPYFLQRCASEIDRFGKDSRYQYYKLIDSINNPVAARLMASTIPLSCALNLLCRVISDICRFINTIVCFLMSDDLAIGDVQAIVADTLGSVDISV